MTPGVHDRSRPLVAVLFVRNHPERLIVPIRSLLEGSDVTIVVGVLYNQFGPVFADLGPRVTWRMVGSVSELVNTVHAEQRCHVAVIDDAVVLPPEPFATAQRWFDHDVRLASVSVLSNAADFLSFPFRNTPIDRAPDGHDERSITRRLRELEPHASPAPIIHAAGSVVVLAETALSAVGHLVAPVSARFDIAVADFSARARAKGFIDVADTSTFVTRSSDIAIEPIDDTLTYDDRGWLLHRHPSLIHFVAREREGSETPFAMAHDLARVKIDGLRVLFDGSCFGPNQVGVPVATLHLLSALAQHRDVAAVHVALSGPIPRYAEETLALPRVQVVDGGRVGEIAMSGPPFDIAYRSFQPTPGFDHQSWRAAARRFAVGMHDTIAFHNGGYFRSSADWLGYRDTIEATLRRADLITTVSADVIEQIELHRLPFERERTVVVPNGTEHVTGHEAGVLPSELAARGFTSGRFAVVVGVNYTHKNRELAMAAHRELWQRGYDDLALVMIGASVPHGTTRVAEAMLGLPTTRVFVLPELESSERNWLLRHAELVWFPTSAEGFGFIPFEAARFGTPTVSVGFGPLNELSGRSSASGSDVPVLAPDWSVDALATTAERFLRDPDLARRHVEVTLAAGSVYTWTAAADRLVVAFRQALARPRR